MPTTLETYPTFESQLRKLAQQHRKSKRGRLRLVVYFAPKALKKRDISLFEIIDGFGGDAVDPDKKLFEFVYGSTPGFPLEPGMNLRMLLTNPTEFHQAVSQNWKAITELRAAHDAGQATILFADAQGKKLWKLLK